VAEFDKSSKDYKEGFDFWGIPAHDDATYPKEIPGFKASVDDFRSSLVDLTKKVLRSFAIYLKLEDPDFFIKQHQAFLLDPTIVSQNIIRTNFYPKLDSSFETKEDTMRLTEHCDFGTVTFLFQDEVGGLEAKLANGEWAPVRPIKDSIVLNAGLMLEMWSGGLFPATVT
jgi:isopenicillin N synthase-like dioxygenase